LNSWMVFIIVIPSWIFRSFDCLNALWSSKTAFRWRRPRRPDCVKKLSHFQQLNGRIPSWNLFVFFQLTCGKNLSTHWTAKGLLTSMGHFMVHNTKYWKMQTFSHTWGNWIFFSPVSTLSWIFKFNVKIILFFVTCRETEGFLSSVNSVMPFQRTWLWENLFTLKTS